MGNTRNTGYLQNIVQYDASNNITLPARLAVTGTVAINNTTPYDTTQFSLDVNGGLIVKNINRTAQFVLINANPATGGNNAFVVHTVGGTSGSSYADIQGYYGTSIAGSTVLRLNPQGGNVLVGSLAGTGNRMVVADSTGVLSTQVITSSLPVGGTAGQLLAKVDSTDYNAQWVNEAPAASYTSQLKHVVKSSQAITKGQAVYVSSADGTNMIVSKASNATEATSSKTMGLLESTVSINGTANVITEGLLAGLDTTGANAAGDPVWLGTDGNLIYGLVNKPVAPAHLVFIGVVTRRNANNGEIFVKVQNGFELDELHDLSVKNASDGDMIKYVASTGLWTKIAATTTNITEGTNLYYTDARVGTYLTNNSYATQSYVGTQIANLVDSAPTTLDTLNELAAALGDDPNFATTVSTSIGTKVPQTRTITINGTAYDLSADRSWSIAAGVTSFNTRTGAITLSSSDVTTALGYTPYNATNPSGYITSSSLSSYVPYSGATSALNLGIYGIFSGDHYIKKNGSSPSILMFEHGSGYPLANSGYSGITASGTNGIILSFNGTANTITFRNNLLTTGRIYSLPDAAGTLALTSDIPTNTNQLTNGAGYITSYTETDTLSTVVARGATTSNAITINRNTGGLTLNRDATTNYTGIYYSTAGSQKWFIGMRENLSSNNYIHYSEQISQDILTLNIANGNAVVYGNISAANLSGTNTGDQTNISGNAATASNVAWSGVTGKPTTISGYGITDAITTGNIGSQSVNYATSAGSSHGIGYDGNAISGMGPISTWDSRPGVGMAGFGISWHTGVSISGYPGYGGVRLYSAGYPTHASSVLRLEASTAVYTFGGLYSDGNAVIHAGNISSQPVVTIQDTAPSGSAGRLWWESDTGKLKVYYGSAWVDASPIPDSSLFFAKAGGSITGDVSIGQTLNVVGNTLVQGNINAFGDITAYSSSDARLKDNITIIESPLEKVSKINGVSFNWNDKQTAYEVGKKDIGVIAQEIEEVLPELVTTRDNGYKAVRYEKIVALLIEAVKEQQTQINNLTDKLNNL